LKLTDHEKRLLDGSEGRAKQLAMELMVQYGTALNAEKLVDCTYVNVGVLSPWPERRCNGFDMEDVDAWFSYLCLNTYEKVKIPPFENYVAATATSPSRELLDFLNAPKEYYRSLDILDDIFKGLGAGGDYSCAPSTVGHCPAMGEHCAVGESSAVVYYNSVFGARTNCEGTTIGLCAGLTQRIPYTGFHTDAGRAGTHLIQVECKPKSVADYDILGYYTGAAITSGTPVFVGDVGIVDSDMHKGLGTSVCSSGGVGMYHFVGHTPEAHTIEQAFQGNKPVDTIVFDEAARKKALERLDFSDSDDVDMIMLGCPHYSLEQLRQVASYLNGKKVKTTLIINTARSTKQVADFTGYTKIIEDAGAHLFVDGCSNMCQLWPEGVSVLATDSGKCSHYTPSNRPDMGIHFGSMHRCLEAAVTGKWRWED